MFTGIIEALGKVIKISDNQIELESVLDEIKIGDSVCVSGVCLTVTRGSSQGSRLIFDISEETFKKTTLGKLNKGVFVNLERAMKSGGRFGGHFVTGHIDERGEIIKLERKNNSVIMQIKGDLRYVVQKGSVAVDGVSLTVADVDEHRGAFAVSLIPHTLENTTLKFLSVGSLVNLEYDIFAKYASNYFSKTRTPAKKITMELLKDEGFF